MHVFIDFDDTLSDMHLFVSQFTRGIAGFLQPKFGGEQSEWEMSAREMVFAIMEDYNRRFVGKTPFGYCSWLEKRNNECSRLLFENMGIPLPQNSFSLAAETQEHALTRCNALYPGARESLEIIRSYGANIHISSANDSEYLNAALRGAGIESFINIMFGPDLVDCAKEGPEFYDLIFKYAESDASEAIVIDDKPEALEWALQLGAKTIQVRLTEYSQSHDVPNVLGVVTDLTDLPSLVATSF